MATGFLQGVVTLGPDGQGVAGAIIRLQRLDDSSVPDQTTITNAFGDYLFQGLDAGSYRITETPPAGYVNDSTHVNSPLTKVTATTSSSIDVLIGDPSALSISYPSRNKEILTTTNNGTTHESLVGQSNITVTQADINYTSPKFVTFCVDYFRDIMTGEQDLPYSMETLDSGLASLTTVKNPQNAGAIAYLYNHVASTWSTEPAHFVPVQQAAGFQLAIWELEYETSGTYNVLDGSFYVHALTANSPEVTAAQGFINIALSGKEEQAVFLNGLPTTARPEGSQGLIAPLSLNFINIASSAPPAPGITIQKLTNGVHDTDPNGSNVVIVSPGAPVTWTYNVANTGNVAFARANVVVTDSVDGVNPTYTGGDTNSNNSLDPGETWVYSATGSALDLDGTTPLPPTVVVVPGDDPGNPGSTRPVYQNIGKVTIADTDLSATDISHYANPSPPPTPSVTIEKFTNGVHDTNPNGTNLVVLSPGAAVTWTYQVSNTGNVVFPKASVVVTDSVTGINPTYTSGDSNNNNILDPNETWTYTATGTALDLSQTPPASVVVVPGGDPNSTGNTRNVYQNTGSVAVTGTDLTASDISHYANPAAPGITIQKFTNGVHDTDPNGANLVIAGPNTAVTWTYDVANTGNVSFAKANVVVSDNVSGVNPTYTSGDTNSNNMLDPGETWIYTATGTALDLSQTPPASVVLVPGGDPSNTGNTRNVYRNTGSVAVTGTDLAASDISHYANAAAPGITIQKFTNGVHDTNPNGNDLVIVNPGTALTWTYDVANTGNVSFAKANVVVSDNVSGVNPAYTSGDTNSNNMLDPGETWIYTATGPALDLTGTLPPTVVVVPGGDPNGTGNTRNVYQNTGTVAVTGTPLSASDISHYANFPGTPPGPTVITLAGMVFHECNNNGVYEPALGETGLANVLVTLSGTSTAGLPVNLTTTTDATGHYVFDLTDRPGVYTVTMAVPSGYLDGKSTPGTAGGTAGTTTISTIDLTASATDYNFAVLLPAALSGVVYYDLNHDGSMGVTDFGIAHVVVTLTGTNDRGAAVNVQTTTGDDGTFAFNGLRPGNYTITRTQPNLFRRYRNTVGSLGGTATRDAIQDITVPGCSTGTGYLFGELQQPTCRLRTLAFHVGRTFARQEAAYQKDPEAFTRAHPNLAPSIANGQIPWGKGTYPKARLARYWVPTLGTKVINYKDVYAKPLSAVRSAAKSANLAARAGAVVAKSAVVAKATSTFHAVKNSAPVKAALAQASRVSAAFRRV